jgi:heme-degrading monooxygenase HmoA
VIIVSGRIQVAAGTREVYLASSMSAIVSARAAPGCLDFVLSADPIEPDRINVYEEWDTEADLLAFRGDGPEPDMAAQILKVDVSRHQVDCSSIGLARTGRRQPVPVRLLLVTSAIATDAVLAA